MSDEPAREASRGAIEVVEFNGEDEEWDAALPRLGESTFCHLGAWRTVIRDTLGHTPHFRIARDVEGRTIGALPLVHVRSRLFGNYLLSMPFLSYGGPLGTAAARGALTDDAVALSASLDVDLLELRCRTPVPGDLHTSTRKITVILPLPETSEELFEKGMKAKVRSQVRRPMKEGMMTRFGPDYVDEFYEVFSRTMRDLGTPVLPRSFFVALSTHFPDQVIFALVDHGPEVAAAACGFLWDGEFEITWAGARRDLSRLSPNMLLYWGLMEESIRRGATAFNFGRCSPDSGTHRFKKQWGGDDHPLPWAQSSPSGVLATPSPESAKFRLATRAWSRLPLKVANAAGPLLSRSLP